MSRVRSFRRVGTRSTSILFQGWGRGNPSDWTARASVYQWGMLNSVCWSVMTWTSSCFITLAQLNGLLLVLGLESATTLPVQAPTVGDEGESHGPAAEFLMILHDLDLGQAGRLVAEALDELAVDRLQISSHVLREDGVLGRVGEDRVMVGIGRPIGFHVLEDEPHVLGPDVERVGGEGGLEEVSGLGLSADLHVEHPQADPGVGPVVVGGDRLEEGSFGRVVLAAVGQPFGERGVKRGGARIIRQGDRLDGLGAQGVDQQPGGGGESGPANPRPGGFPRLPSWHYPRASRNRSSEMFRSARRTWAEARSGVDLERPLGLLPAGGELVALEIGLAQRDDDLGGGRVDLEGPQEFLASVPFLVPGKKQPALMPGRLPAVGVDPDGRLVDVIDDLVQLLAQLLVAELGADVLSRPPGRRSGALEGPWRAPGYYQPDNRRTT